MFADKMIETSFLDLSERMAKRLKVPSDPSEQPEKVNFENTCVFLVASEGYKKFLEVTIKNLRIFTDMPIFVWRDYEGEKIVDEEYLELPEVPHEFEEFKSFQEFKTKTRVLIKRIQGIQALRERFQNVILYDLDMAMFRNALKFLKPNSASPYFISSGYYNMSFAEVSFDVDVIEFIMNALNRDKYSEEIYLTEKLGKDNWKVLPRTVNLFDRRIKVKPKDVYILHFAGIFKPLVNENEIKEYRVNSQGVVYYLLGYFKMLDYLKVKYSKAELKKVKDFLLNFNFMKFSGV